MKLLKLIPSHIKHSPGMYSYHPVFCLDSIPKWAMFCFFLIVTTNLLIEMESWLVRFFFPSCRFLTRNACVCCLLSQLHMPHWADAFLHFILQCVALIASHIPIWQKKKLYKEVRCCANGWGRALLSFRLQTAFTNCVICLTKAVIKL